MIRWLPGLVRGGVRSYYSYSHEPFHPLKRAPAWRSAEEAVSVIKSGEWEGGQGERGEGRQGCGERKGREREERL